MINRVLLLFLFLILSKPIYAKEDIMILKLKNGEVVIELFTDIAPNTVERIKKLASENEKRFIFSPIFPHGESLIEKKLFIFLSE